MSEAEPTEDAEMAVEESSAESELEDDDYDLIEENLGVKVQRRKFKRVRRISDDSDDEGVKGPGDDRDAIAQQLFEGSDNEEDKGETVDDANRDHYSSNSEEDYSDADDFIVDDEGQPIKESRRLRKRRSHVSDAKVQEAQDIFGIDFDYSEFEKIGEGGDDDGDDGEGDDSEYEDEPDHQRASSKRKRHKPDKPFREVFEPFELERAGYTDKDSKLRAADVPERLQTRAVPVTEAKDEELDEEAEWVFRQAKFEGVKKKFVSLPAPEASEANWGQDWDSKTTVPTTAPAGAPIPPTAPTNSGWEDDWETQTAVPAPPATIAPATAGTSATLPPPPASNAWEREDDDWETPAASKEEPAPAPPMASTFAVPKAPAPKPQAPKSKSNADWADAEDWEEAERPKSTTPETPVLSGQSPDSVPTISTEPSNNNEEFPAPAASVAGTDTGWGDDWDKGTTVSAADFVDWKRPALPGSKPATAKAGEGVLWERRASTSNEASVAPSPASVADTWAADWEKRTGIQRPNTDGTLAPPPLSVTDSASVVAPVPLEDNNEAKTIPKIRNTLEFIRNQKFEIPFIAFYRKECVLPELSLNDLWKIYWLDAKFCDLKSRKKKLEKLFKEMRAYHAEKCLLYESTDSVEMEEFKTISDEHIERIRGIKTVDELNDNALYFRIYYSEYVKMMKDYIKVKRQEKQLGLGHGAAGCSLAMLELLELEEDDEPVANADENESADFKKTSIYELKQRDHFGGNYSKLAKMEFNVLFLKKMGITSENFAENLRDKYQRNEVEQWLYGPLEVAQEIIAAKSLRSRPDDILKTARFMFAVQIANEPLVRQCARKEFFEKATLTCFPTKQGLRDIDEFHPVYRMKYLKDKPVKTLKEDEFLKLTMAEKDRLIDQIVIGESFVDAYFDEIKPLIIHDAFSKTVQDWNALREESLKAALDNLLPELRKELRVKLLEDCYDYILERCGSKLHHWLNVSPMKVSYPEENEIEWDTSQGLRVMAITYDLVFDRFGVMIAVIRPDGEPDVRSFRHDEDPTDRLKLENMLRHKPEDKVVKEADIKRLKVYIRDMKPHVIAIAGESREANRLKTDVDQIVAELVTEDAFPEIKVEIVDNEAAKVYASSKRSVGDLGNEYSTLLRQAISLARRIQDPLLEFSLLWNPDEDILCLKFHPLQEQVPKERLLERLQVEFINRTCEVGVDINRALNYPHTANVVQFISGLGPRKAAALLHNLRQNHGRRLENRSQLLTLACMGKQVFLNCAGFIKIDTVSVAESTDSYVEVLDGTRIHPESYELARQIASAALSPDGETEANPRASAVEEIMDDADPIKLNDLDLEKLAVFLKESEGADKLETLYDIREELKGKYRDMRVSYAAPEPDELFHMLTKQTPDIFCVGRLVNVTVGHIIRRMPRDTDNEEQLPPLKNENTGKWQCPFCGERDFPELSEVWAHLDNKSCPGPAIGIRIYLDNGILGFIPITRLSDRPVIKPEDRVRPGQKIYCRISKISVEHFSVDATSRTSDLADARDEWRPKKDDYYDKERETFELNQVKEQEERQKQQQQRQVYVKRVIVHPSFKNVSYHDACKLLETMDHGEVIVRPSSKGPNHLTVTWKVADGIFQHIAVREEGKTSAFSLGQSLWIEDEEFEDIDEIIARYINPMASNARDIITYKYYVSHLGADRSKTDDFLKMQKQKNPNKIHYVFQASNEMPGKFMLSYLPRNEGAHEFTTVTPEGFRFRQQMFEDFDSLLQWFKIHYRDPPPASTRVNMANNYAADVSQRVGYPIGGQNANYGAVAGPSRQVPQPPQTHHTTPHYSTPQQLTPYSANRHASNVAAVTPRVVETPGSKRTPQAAAPPAVNDDECWE